MQSIVQIVSIDRHTHRLSGRTPDSETDYRLTIDKVTDSGFKEPEKDRAGPITPEAVGAMGATEDAFIGSLEPMTGAPANPESLEDGGSPRGGEGGNHFTNFLPVDRINDAFAVRASTQ